jgi:glyoxylase-like metal-dependent hydrolase (beta-lactamase superfamily II)
MDAFTDIPMVASRKCIENMPRSVRLRERVVEVFDDELTIGDENLRVEFHLVSGHSVGSSVAYIPDEKVLFGGDLCLSSSFHYGMPIMHYYQNRPKRTGNPDEYIAAFQKIRKWKVETIVPGHGNIIICARDYIDDQISFFTELKSFFISSIDEGMTLENIEMPNLRSISEAYSNASARTQKSQSIRSLDHILELLKISFYNHYSRVS